MSSPLENPPQQDDGYATGCGTSAQAIRLHYDVDPAFYALWLDPTLAYSCALWDGPQISIPQDVQQLEQTQLAKFDWHARSAGAQGAARVLDLGCGFGGLMRRLVDFHQVQHVVGLTLSATQHAHICALGDERIEARLESWQQHHSIAPYDAIISVGVLEHAARPEMRSEQKIAAYRHFFARCHAWLRPGGRMSLQTIAKGNTAMDRQAAANNLWILENIYPESELARLCEISEAIEKQFELVQLRNDRLDYARTCEAWLAQMRAKREQALQLVDENTFAMFERYLEICVQQFRQGHASLLRMELKRV